jgi:hypothetical protein
MKYLHNFHHFLLESKYQEDTEEKGISSLDRMVYDEGGAAKRLLGQVFSGIKKISKGISNLFGDKNAEKMSLDDLEKNRSEILDKWGEGIRISGKNKKKDYEDFYRKYTSQGRDYFGEDFNLNSPRNREEIIYSRYARDARKYFTDDF